MAGVDQFLNANMSPRLVEQVAPRTGNLIRQRPLDVARSNVVTLDEVAVVAIHHPNQPGEARGGGWAKRCFEFRGRGDQLGQGVERLRARWFEVARLDAKRRLKRQSP